MPLLFPEKGLALLLENPEIQSNRLFVTAL